MKTLILITLLLVPGSAWADDCDTNYVMLEDRKYVSVLTTCREKISFKEFRERLAGENR